MIQKLRVLSRDAAIMPPLSSRNRHAEGRAIGTNGVSGFVQSDIYDLRVCVFFNIPHQHTGIPTSRASISSVNPISSYCYYDSTDSCLRSHWRNHSFKRDGIFCCDFLYCILWYHDLFPTDICSDYIGNR